jgi:subfamily B ATP-binding cassette protein MsbA
MALGLNSDATAVLRRLLTYVRPYAFVIVPAGIAIVIYTLVTVAVPILLEGVFEQLQNSARDVLLSATSVFEALKLPLVIAVAFLVRSTMDFFTVYGLSWVGRSAIRDLRTDLFRHYLYLPAAFFDRHASGDLISRLTFNTEQIAEGLSNSIVIIVRDLLLVVSMIGVMLYFSVELTLVLAIVGPVLAGLLSAMSRAFRRYGTRIQGSMGDVTRAVGQALQGQRVVKIYAGQQYETERFDEINRRNFRLHLRLVATRAFGDSLTQYVVVLAVSIMLFFVLTGWLTPTVADPDVDIFDSPELLGFITALAVLLSAMRRLVGANASLQRAIAAATSLFEILDAPIEAPTAGQAPSASGPSAQPAATEREAPAEGPRLSAPATGHAARAAGSRAAGSIEFDHVSFRYGPNQDEVLHDLSFRLEPGQTLALVGRSGGGKSTIVSLLPRFYDPTSGSIRLDGRDLRDYPLRELRDQFSFVGQDVVLFDDTIAGNIAYGALSKASRDEIERAAATAYVDQFTADLPDGLDTHVGEAGALLSGGQRQRVAIARAVLKNAPILILDEATSALDSESERHVQAALTELMRGRTTLIIAHRLSTVEQADRILVMHDGRLVEMGTHAELIAAGGFYASLYRLQFTE